MMLFYQLSFLKQHLIVLLHQLNLLISLIKFKSFNLINLIQTSLHSILIFKLFIAF